MAGAPLSAGCDLGRLWNESFILILNAADETLEYVLSEDASLPHRTVLIDTSREVSESGAEQPVTSLYTVGSRSVVEIIYRGKR
jgi:hypothetical protein